MDKIKRKNLAKSNIIKLLLLYYLMAHLIACIFIYIGNLSENINESWYIKVPAPYKLFPEKRPSEELYKITDFDKYIHALYWTYVTTSHVGVGDVTGVNPMEKTFSIIVMFISIISSTYIFGNLASMVGDLAPILKNKFDQKYQAVIQAINDTGLQNFLEKINSFYSYIWRSDLGLDENEILQKLPIHLKIAIVHDLYSDCLQKSTLFTNQHEDKFLVDSIIRFFTIAIYLP